MTINQPVTMRKLLPRALLLSAPAGVFGTITLQREDRDRNYGLTNSISKYTFCLLHKNVTLASQYLR
jgi:hypothetical protein